MIGVVHRPDGIIVQSVRGTEAAIARTAAALGLAYLVLDEGAMDRAAIDALDHTHRVADGALVEAPDA